MFNISSEVYDIFYQYRGYEKQAETIEQIINLHAPKAQSILDIGCGTGEFLRFLKKDYQMSGMDLNEDFLISAKNKIPKGQFVNMDMTSFNLNKTYDIITCLFSSIGYVKTYENTVKTLKLFKKHLSPQGIIIIEPWFHIENNESKKIFTQTSTGNDITVMRMSYNGISAEEKLSLVNFHYLIGTKNGIQHYDETHELCLLSADEMQNAFKEAALSAEYKKTGFMDRGLYIAK